jgi:hypothetical protein
MTRGPILQEVLALLVSHDGQEVLLPHILILLAVHGFVFWRKYLEVETSSPHDGTETAHTITDAGYLKVLAVYFGPTDPEH